MKFDLDFEENEASSSLKFDSRSEDQKIGCSKDWSDGEKKMSKNGWHQREELNDGFSSKRRCFEFKYARSSY
jgi:hypothetical protein